jgi:capsule biosynthesis phosphatase
MGPPTDKRVVFDIDGVLCKKDEHKDYEDRIPHTEMVERLQDYYEEGYYIILYTARNMNTHQGRIGKINADTAKTLLQWLDEHNIPHDEIYYGKPWCGYDGFYVDDKAIRPSELANNTTSEIQDILDKESEYIHS